MINKLEIALGMLLFMLGIGFIISTIYIADNFTERTTEVVKCVDGLNRVNLEGMMCEKTTETIAGWGFDIIIIPLGLSFILMMCGFAFFFRGIKLI